MFLQQEFTKSNGITKQESSSPDLKQTDKSKKYNSVLRHW